MTKPNFWRSVKIPLDLSPRHLEDYEILTKLMCLFKRFFFKSTFQGGHPYEIKKMLTLFFAHISDENKYFLKVYIYILAGAPRRAWYEKWLMLSQIRTLSNLLPLLRYSGLPNKGKSGKSRDPTKVLAFKQGSHRLKKSWNPESVPSVFTFVSICVSVCLYAGYRAHLFT